MENQEYQNTNPAPLASDVSQTPAGKSPLGGFPPVSNPPKRKFSFVVVFGIILFLLIAGGVFGYFALKPQIEKRISKPTPNVTRSTKSTMSDKLLVETKYYSLNLPREDIEFYDNSEEGMVKIRGSMGAPGYESLKIEVSDANEKTSYIEKDLQTVFSEVLNAVMGEEVQVCENVNKSICTYIKSEDIKAKNVTFAHIYNDNPFEIGNNNTRELYLVKFGSKYFVLHYYYDKKTLTNGKLSKDDVYQILSTFKFTDATGGIDKAGWKTYDAPKFTFMYPQNWIIQDLWTNPEKGHVSFRSSDYVEEGEYPDITKGFSINVYYGEKCVNTDLILSGPTPSGSYRLQQLGQNKNKYLIERAWERLSYEYIPNKNIDVCLVMFVESLDIKTPFAHPTFLNNKNDLLKAGDSFKVKKEK